MPAVKEKPKTVATKEPQKFQVEKKVPVPPRTRECGESKYPFAGMNIGDSFLLEREHSPKDAAFVASLCNSTTAKRHGRFIYRTVDEGYRVWKAEPRDEE